MTTSLSILIDEPTPVEPRFELIRFRNPDQPITILLARKDNGMVVGGTSGIPGGIWQAQFGTQANESINRSFVGQEPSLVWLKRQATLMCRREDVDFESRDGEAQILVPRSQGQRTGRII